MWKSGNVAIPEEKIEQRIRFEEQWSKVVMKYEHFYYTPGKE